MENMRIDIEKEIETERPPKGPSSLSTFQNKPGRQVNVGKYEGRREKKRQRGPMALPNKF